MNTLKEQLEEIYMGLETEHLDRVEKAVSNEATEEIMLPILATFGTGTIA